MSSWCCRRRAVAAQGSQLRPLHGGDADGEAGGDDDEDIEREAAEARHRGREAGRRTVAGADQLVAVSLRHGDLAVGALFARAAGGITRTRELGVARSGRGWCFRAVELGGALLYEVDHFCFQAGAV